MVPTVQHLQAKAVLPVLFIAKTLDDREGADITSLQHDPFHA